VRNFPVWSLTLLLCSCMVSPEETGITPSATPASAIDADSSTPPTGPTGAIGTNSSTPPTGPTGAVDTTRTTNTVSTPGFIPPAEGGMSQEDRDPTGWVIVPDSEGPHAPELYPRETFSLTYVGSEGEIQELAFRCYERLASPGICITAHCAYNGQSALSWARWCGAGETALHTRPDIVAAVFEAPPVPVSAPADQGRGVVLTPNPYWHADLIPPVVCFTGHGIKETGTGWVMVFGAEPAADPNHN